MKKKLTPFLYLGVFSIIVVIAIVKMFGTTISQKFGSANGAVVNDVTFGYGGGGEYRGERERQVDYRSAAKPSAVAPASGNIGYVKETKPVENQRSISDKKTSEEYKDYGVNPLTKTANDKFSTFSIDVDTASYTISRKKINAGVTPPQRRFVSKNSLTTLSMIIPNQKRAHLPSILKARQVPLLETVATILCVSVFKENVLRRKSESPFILPS